MPSTARFLRQYLRPREDVTRAEEVSYRRGAEELPATVFLPRRRRRSLPGWVVLHGLTRPGRKHPALIRFAQSVAHAGNIVMVPEIPEWRELRVAPAVTVQTIRAAVRALQLRDDVNHGHVGLFGFSFGATQGLIAAWDAETASLLHGVASWGGYYDLRRVCHFGLTGLHELDGVTFQMKPDPYGSWILAGNYLPQVPGYAGSEPVAQALHALALDAGEQRIYAWDPIYDVAKNRLRAQLPPDQRELFDLIAPLTTAADRDLERVLALAERIADTALELDPLLDPRPFLSGVRVPVQFAHGRDDRLIPFTETVRLSRALPPAMVRGTTITSLFQHSGGTQAGLGLFGLAREAVRFVGLLRQVLRVV